MIDILANRVQTIGEVTRSIRGLLETSFSFVTVIGEVSNLRQPFSGHLYFTLKDQDAQLKAVLFKNQQRYLADELRDGQEVVCRGRISLYEPRGEYQLLVDVVDTKGVGALQIAFAELKQRLAAEGLFDEARKRPLPFLPERVAVMTSPQGAALFDFLHMAGHRFPGIPIEIFPVRVQGDGAADDIVEALRLLNVRATAEVIVLCRGGGSIEDLWSFNEERVARAIHASTIPVVSAIGHEVDYTIADFVADHRAPTPSAAAEAVLPDQTLLRARSQERTAELAAVLRRLLANRRQQTELSRRSLTDPTALLARFLLRLDQQQNRIHHHTLNRLRLARQRLDRLTIRLLEQNPRQRLAYQQRWLAELVRRIEMSIDLHLERQTGRLQHLAGLLDAVSPLAVLARGYAIVRSAKDGVMIRDSAQINNGDQLEILLHRGGIDCQVTGRSDTFRGR